MNSEENDSNLCPDCDGFGYDDHFEYGEKEAHKFIFSKIEDLED